MIEKNCHNMARQTFRDVPRLVKEFASSVQEQETGVPFPLSCFPQHLQILMILNRILAFCVATYTQRKHRRKSD